MARLHAGSLRPGIWRLPLVGAGIAPVLAVAPAAASTAQEPHHAGQRNERQCASGPHEVQDARRIFAGGRVVVETIEQHLVRRRADLVGRRLHQPQPQVAAGKLDAVEIAGDPALRRQDHDAAGVNVLILLGIVDVAKPNGTGQLLDRLGLAREKVPAFGSTWSSIVGDVVLLLGRRQIRSFPRVEADGHDVVIRADGKRHAAHALDEPIEHQRAKHGTSVVGHDQDDGLVSKIIAQLDRGAGFVGEFQVQGNLFIEPLVETHVAQCGRGLRVGAVRGSWGRGEQEYDQALKRYRYHFHGSGPRNMRPEFDSPASNRPLPLAARPCDDSLATGKVPATAFMACSMGICTNPFSAVDP